MVDARWIRKKNGVEIYRFVRLENSFPPHFHKYGLVGRLLAGKRVLRVNGDSRVLSVGDIVVIKPREVHSCERIGAEYNIWQAATIPARYFTRVEEISNFPVLDKIASREREDLFNKIESDSDPVPILNYESALDGDTDCQKNRDERFSKLLAEFEKRLEFKFEVAEMASSISMDKFSFIRKFAASFHITPHKYLDSLRVARGCELLSRGKTIGDCAPLVGLYDQSHFTSLFRRYVGVTPAVYKNAGNYSGGVLNLLSSNLPEEA